MTRSADLPLEICSAISVFLIATHPLPLEMEDDSIWSHPSNDQDVYIYCGIGEGPFMPCLVFEIGFGLEL